MRDIACECIEFKNEVGFCAFGDELWDEARRLWNNADDETKELVWDRIREWVNCASCDGELVSLSQINDMIWFECDDLFFPPSYTLKVYQHDDDDEIMGEPLPVDDGEDDETEIKFEGLHAKDDALEWWKEHNNDYDLDMVFAHVYDAHGNETDVWGIYE